MKENNKKELPYERVLFFSDAIVAIAITLLALELKINIPENEHLTFSGLLEPWHQYAAFILSFINIAGFWNTHHQLFTHITKMNDRLKFMNILWLFFIVVLPFSSGVLSNHYRDCAGVFLYALNVFCISVCQNFLWDYSEKAGFVSGDSIDEENKTRFRVMFNLDMLNGLVAIIFSFFTPLTAFILLFFKVPLFVAATFYLASLRKKGQVRKK